MLFYFKDYYDFLNWAQYLFQVVPAERFTRADIAAAKPRPTPSPASPKWTRLRRRYRCGAAGAALDAAALPTDLDQPLKSLPLTAAACRLTPPRKEARATAVRW